MLKDFGTISLVLYHRLKEEEYFKDYLLFPINSQITPEIMASRESIMTLINQVLTLVTQSLEITENTLDMKDDPKREVKDVSGFLKGILRVIPSARKLKKTIKKRMRE